MVYQEKRLVELFDIKKLDYRSQLKSKLHNEGIVIGSDGTLGIDYCTDEYSFSNVILFLENKSNGEVLSKYVYYYLLANQDWIERVFKCMKRVLISQLLSHLSIKYPPIIEQYEIVQKLDIVQNLYNWQVQASDNLIQFPYTCYQRMEKALGMMWKHDIKLRELVHIRQGKSCKKMDLLNVCVDRGVIEIYGKSKVALTIINDKYDPYFIACILPLKKILRMLEDYAIDNKIPLLRIENISLKVPNKREQLYLVDLYKKVDAVKNDMMDAIKQINVLKDYYLHYYLYRKIFGRNFSSFDEKEIVKYSYKIPAMVDSLQTYDALREELYNSLLCGDKEQYFDANTNSVKLRKKS